MRRRLLALLLALCTLMLVACNRGNETSITFSEKGVLTAEISTTRSGSVRLPQPAGTHAAHCVGWVANTDEGTVFLPVGAEFSYKRGDSLSFSPVYLHLTTLSETKIDLSAENGGLIFTTTLGTGEWQRLVDIGAAPTCGTLIITQLARETLTAFTHDDISANNIAATDISAVFTDATSTAYTAQLQDITPGKRLTAYTAIGYLHLNYSDGSSTDVYATHEHQAAPVASLLGLAKSAVEDLSDTPSDIYQTPVGDKFSPYTAEEYALLEGYAKLAVGLIINHAMRGNRGLPDSLLDAFDQRTIQHGDPTCVEEWRILRGLIPDIRQDGALVITAKDGTFIERDNISEITFTTKISVVTITNAVFYNGSIYVPYSNYSGNY